MSPTFQPRRYSAGQLGTLRAKYQAERDRRIRPEGTAQYRRAAGEFSSYAKDPYTEWAERDPVRDRVDAVVIGGGSTPASSN